MWILACSFGLGLATPSRAEDDVRPREVRVCVRPPTESLDRWVFSNGGKVLTERWAKQVYGARNITVYVFDPNAPAISATYFPPRLFPNLKCPAKVAPKKLAPKAAPPKSEAGPRKKKTTTKEAEEPEAAKPKPKEREAEPHEAKKVREAEAARLKKEADEAKKERERRAKLAQEESRRRRERERPKVLPREGVTAAWPSRVLPKQKDKGVTAAWSSKVLPAAGVLPRAGAPLCSAPAPKRAGGKDSAATMAVRQPILKELLGYKKATGETAREAHRRRLRELFESVDASSAEPFHAMLSSPNALAVTFRGVLQGDPLQNELLGILTKKYAPDPSQCTPSAPPPAVPPGVTLPGVTLTDEESFDVLHAEVEQRITELREGCGRIVRSNMRLAKKALLEQVRVLANFLAGAQRVKVAAFQETDAAKRAEGLKRAGSAYLGLFYVTQLWKLYVSIAVVTDDADEAGVSSSIWDKAEDNPLAKLLVDFENDKAIIALTKAGLEANEPGMAASLPAASKAYELHIAGLNRWIVAVNRGAILSKKVVQVADILMIAISIYQVWKVPAVAAGGTPTPPTILGTLPGGAAVGQVVSLASLARALESIRRLVAIGALDGALIGGIGMLGGGPGIALPELQRPTSLSVQGPGGGSGSTGPQGTAPIGQGDLKIVEQVDDVVEIAGKVGGHEIRVLANIERQGSTLFLRRAHIEGPGAGKVGVKALLDAIKDFGRSQGVSKVVVEGAKRTTGAGNHRGAVPRPWEVIVE